MQNKILRKGLVVGIIILFIGLAFIPSFNAESISMSDDTTPPEIYLEWESWKDDEGKWIIHYIANCSDDESGMDRVEFILDNTTVEICYSEPYEWTCKWSQLWGHYYLYAFAYDKAGNYAFDCDFLRTRSLNIESPKEDCDCQSNAKTHLAEKLLNILEKNKVISNIIDLNAQEDDRPICSFLENIGDYYAELLVKYMDLAYTDPDGPYFWFYFSLGVTCEVIIGYIFIVGGILLCWV